MVFDPNTSHLRPVPDHQVEGSAARAADPAAHDPTAYDPAAAGGVAAGGIPGITPPIDRAHSSGFITDVLVQLGYASPEQVEQAIEQARTASVPAEQLLVKQGALHSDHLARAIAERYGLDHLDFGHYQVDMAAANLIAVSTARRHLAIPVGFLDSGTLLVAMADPANVLAIDDIQLASGFDCRVAVAAADDIESLIGRLGSLESAVADSISAEKEEEEGEEATISDLRASAEDAPVVKLVYSILGQAVTEGASDIHFEAEQDDMRVRMRVDGVLMETARVPKRMSAAVVSRVKIMSELDIAEKRIPQDGRVSVNVNDRQVDLRVVTLPTQAGEGLTIRILDKDNAMMSLDELGMTGEARVNFESAFRRAYGAVLVTGPTGSGKSTTLYAALNDLNKTEKKIITIEDPVEYQLAGVNQINVHRKAGLDFATGLRSVLRADPDIVMVGEIRDAETARIAIEAALTGHMMLSTLHTNDAPGAIARLAKMGVEPFLTASSVDCVVAQRLARKLCPHCKQRAIIGEAAIRNLGFRSATEFEAYEPAGCGRCNHSGYRGRVGIYSVMVMSERIKELTVENASEAVIAQTAHDEGMLTLREDGLAKVRSGMTSIEEVLRVTT